MDTLSSENLLQTVQLIPIFSYLNVLSDFLFTENYLTELNQTKQIPIVNAVYEYLEDYCFNKSMKVKLIRSLLQGSDLYGAKNNEELDVIFVNTMFEYIISSLVFDKYGNIYGFLANVFGKAKSLQVDYVFKLIKETIQNASFENEYGDRSSLTSLSVNRIYNDIIMPLFPQTYNNLDISSLDYIYAQAGLMFLRPGRINNVYYNELENDFTNIHTENLFNEYLMIGHVIEELLLTEKKSIKILKAFALPALSYYIFNSKYLFAYKNVVHIISDANFWHSAYTFLFQYTVTASNDTNVQLKDDYYFQLHMEFSSFRSRTTLAKHFINLYCSQTMENWQNLTVLSYSENSKNRQCKNGEILPDINQLRLSKINDIIEIYKTFDLKLVKKAFGKSLISYIENGNLTVKLLHFYDQIEKGNFFNSKQLSYDVLEFLFHENKTRNYYILIRENYNVTLINKAKNPQIYRKKVGLSDQILRIELMSVILKTPNNDINQFWENLMEYKITRLRSYLTFFDVDQGKNESWKNDWWKEFGLSLVPYYPCLSDISDTNCREDTYAADNLHFLNQFQEDISSKILHTNTQEFLFSLGTTIRSVFLKDICDEATERFASVLQEYKYLLTTDSSNSVELFDNIRFHIEEPAFELTFVNQVEIRLIEKVINILNEQTDFSFKSIKKNLYKMSILKSKFFKSVGIVGENKTRLIYINTLGNETNMGYGYKFIFISRNMSETAQFRTDYESKNESLVLRIHDLPKYEKTYIRLNNASLELEHNNFMYEVDNKLRTKSTRTFFLRTSTYNDDYKCNDNIYFDESKYLTVCLRQRRFFEKLDYEREAIRYVKNGTNLPEEQIRNTFKNYLFPDRSTLLLFVKSWVASANFKTPAWSDNYIIDNPDLLVKLRYFPRLENHTISDYAGTFRINSIYSLRERRKIEEQTSLKEIINDYNEQKEGYSVTFEDYYAIRNFATTGYTRITGDTHEANLMKFALYKLAIRQSDDPNEEFDFKLFRVESKPISIINNDFLKRNITLQKFTLASVDVESALRFATYPEPGFMNIMYEMIFYGSYVRVKFEEFYSKVEKKVILLPGSGFEIEDQTTVTIEGLGKVFKVKLKFNNNLMEKHAVYKNIMNRIEHIRF